VTTGRFVVIEGGDASGKSTQVTRLADRLRRDGHEVVETFEPGATDLGTALRSLLLEGPEVIDPVAETLLLAADRAQQVREVVRPALARGAHVVSDRYEPSSLAYQGVGRGVGVDAVEAVNRLATGGLEPDVVVVLDVDDVVADARRAGPGDRLERAGGDFHARVRQAYRDLAAERGWHLVDGGADAAIVAERVWAVVRARLAP
jgi:dTMP kinase